MLIDWLSFDYEDQVLLEKYVVKTPLRHELHFDNRGCFIYFKGVELNLLSPEFKGKVNDQESVLFKCGHHYLDLLNQTSEEHVEIFVLHLYPEVLRNIFIKDLPQIIQERAFEKQSQVIASNEVISKFIESLEFYFQNPTLVNNDLLELKMKELVLLLVQSKYLDSILELIEDLYSGKRVRLRKTIETHLYTDLSVEELASLCSLSLSSFKREFKKEFSDSPINYITTKRLEKARELLKVTSLSVSEIAYEVGFNDPLYFTRAFKKKFGLAPTNAR
ncbi:MAG: AraC family transcriptional regulator [Cytophagales bacterium]|nr:AraC family transcriptional regulator [Cytophagales bacterium]